MNTWFLLIFTGLMAFSFQPQPAYQRILFVGNSLTVAKPAPTIFWDGYHGMASTQPDRDFIHRIQLKLAVKQGVIPEIGVLSTDINRWPGNPTGILLFHPEQTAQSFDPDLVIVQVGDNTKGYTYEQWLEKYQIIKAWTPNARHVVLGLWNKAGGEREDFAKRSAEATGMEYLKIYDLHINATSAIGHPVAAVSWHPNDLGHERIAQRVIDWLLASVFLPTVFVPLGGTVPGTIP